jgi:hypothetical protein
VSEGEGPELERRHSGISNQGDYAPARALAEESLDSETVINALIKHAHKLPEELYK